MEFLVETSLAHLEFAKEHLDVPQQHWGTFCGQMKPKLSCLEGTHNIMCGGEISWHTLIRTSSQLGNMAAGQGKPEMVCPPTAAQQRTAGATGQRPNAEEKTPSKQPSKRPDFNPIKALWHDIRRAIQFQTVL